MTTHKTLIKICGVQQAEMAYAAACAGANFIGIILVPSSRRAVNVAMACDIAANAKAGGATPVAVFAEASATDMSRICEKAGIEWVQLHGELSRHDQYLLPERWHRIYVCPVLA